MKPDCMYLDGQIIKINRATLNVFTPGNFQAKGIFETIRTDEGKPRNLDEHGCRLKEGLKYFKIKNPLSDLQWKSISKEVLKYNTFKLARLRWMVWCEKKKVHYAVMVLPYVLPSDQQYTKGLRVCVFKTDRDASSRLANVKSLDYSLFARCYQKALALGFDDALLINNKGYIFESTRANVFALINNHMITPPLRSGCLQGIIRSQFIALGPQINMPVIERNITLNMLGQASSVMLTNSLMGMIPIDLKLSQLKISRILSCSS